jgi:uncharacterized protein (DUF342 family)
MEGQGDQTGLDFRLTEEGAKLEVAFTPVDERPPISLPWLKETLAARGLPVMFLLEDALAELFEKYPTAKEPFSLVIGERRDGTFTITVSADKMEAHLAITPPVGGSPVTKERIFQGLEEKGVRSGILRSAIEEAVASGRAQSVLIARGREPVNGEDAQFHSLIAEAKSRRPQVDEHGIADYRNLGQLLTVKAGDPLMQRVPATLGEHGENVMGDLVPPKPGKDSYFAPGLKGAEVDPGDINLLRAAISGQPVLVKNGMMVEPTITFNNVDLSTGNVNFEGTVNITADVKSGMKIHATGDVIIGGTVEAVTIDAGGDVTVKGGIIGLGESKGHGAEANAGYAHIRCNGSVSARFIENAKVTAGNSIVVEELVKQCELSAVNQVIVGRENSRKGHIIGGVTKATMLVQAVVIGSSAGVATTVEVGLNPTINDRLEAIKKTLQEKMKEQEELHKALAYIHNNPGRVKEEIREKAERTHEKIMLDISDLFEEKATLQKQLELCENAKVVVKQKVHSGVQIRIGHKVRDILDEREAGVFKLREGDIFFSDN